MDEKDWLADRFEEHRVRLRAAAYRMLGSLAEADDAVQDTWLRVSRSEASEVENLGGWLTTIVARVCLNALRSRNVRREESLPVYLPDPCVGESRRGGRYGLLQRALGIEAQSGSRRLVVWRSRLDAAGHSAAATKWLEHFHQFRRDLTVAVRPL